MRHGYGVRTSAPFGLASHRPPPPEGPATGAAAAAPGGIGTGALPGSATGAASGTTGLTVESPGGVLGGLASGAGAAQAGLSGMRRKLGALGRGSQYSLSGEEGGGAQPPLARRAMDAEGARGGFVLRAKSDDIPHRRRSLVERTGMKTFVQVESLIFY